MIDLHGLFRARWFGARGATAIPLYAPQGVLARVAGLEEVGEQDGVQRVFDWHGLPATSHQVGPFRLDSWSSRWAGRDAEMPASAGWGLPHFVTNAGVRLSAPGLIVAYTGDTGPDPALAELGRDADLYIVEATDRGQHLDSPPGPAKLRMHLTAREAAQAATAAGARRLLLTHFWPDTDRNSSRAAATASFAGEVLIADEGLEIELP